MMKIASVVAVVLLASGCFKHQYAVGTTAVDTHAAPSVSEWRTHYIGGIGGTARVNVGELCGGHAGVVGDRVSFTNGVVGALTLGVYTPSTVEAWCVP